MSDPLPSQEPSQMTVAEVSIFAESSTEKLSASLQEKESQLIPPQELTAGKVDPAEQETWTVMPDYSEAVERVADWLDEFATAVEANPNLLENHDRYDDAQAVLTAAGANESEDDMSHYMSAVSRLRADNERLKIEVERLKLLEKGVREQWGKEIKRNEADYDELVIQAAKERGILNAEQAENERLREALSWYADEKNYDDEGRPGFMDHIPSLPTNGGEEWEWESDFGDRARKALSTPTNRKDDDGT